MRGPVYQTVDDTTLIDLALEGDGEAFRSIVQRYQNMIYSLMMRQVKSSAIAQDLTQDIFLKVFSALPQFERRSSFKTWLTRIAMNTAGTYFQSRNYKEWIAMEELRVETTPAFSAGEPAAEKERSLRILQLALTKLDPKFRDVIVLCKLEGKTYEEAATLLQISVGTVGSRLNSAQHELRRLFWRMNR